MTTEFMPIPSEHVSSPTLFGAAYALLLAPTGRQANLVLRAKSSGDSNYLTITVKDKLIHGKGSNDIKMTTAEGTALHVDYDSYARELSITYLATSTLAQIKSKIDELTTFAVVLTGSSGAAEEPGFERQFTGGRDNVIRNVTVSIPFREAVRLYYSESATPPAATATGYVLMNMEQKHIRLPANRHLFGIREGNSNVNGSVEAYYLKGSD